MVGVGVMGAAAGRALARADREVLMLERFRVGHDRGSSHGRARIFRLSYDDPLYVRMAIEALPLWRDLEAETDQPIMKTIGGLDLGPGAEANAEALGECGVAHERLDAAEVARRFPAIAPPRGTAAVFQGDAGVVSADLAWTALVRSAVASGAELREGAEVAGVRVESDRVVIATRDEELRARVAVVTAGAWSRGLLAGASVRLETRPTRETVAFFRLQGSLPTVVEWGAPAAYALPSRGQGLKAGIHHAGPTADPDRHAGPAREAVAEVEGWVRARFPGADPHPHLAETCLYTNTPDERFVLERHGPVVVGSPCSGHGFKFAPLIGERLAALAARGR